MREYQRSQRKLPAAFREEGKGSIRVAITFEDEQYEAIRAYAEDHGISFSASVRRLISHREAAE